MFACARVHQITYVAQENVILDTPSDPLNHPLIEEMFASFDVQAGRFIPSPSLQAPSESES